MPQLHEHQPACLVYLLTDLPPTTYLRLGINAGRPRITLPLLRNLRGFRNQQCSAGTLAVVLGVHRSRYITGLSGAGACQGCHGHTMGKLERANGDRLEKMLSHDFYLWKSVSGVCWGAVKHQVVANFLAVLTQAFAKRDLNGLPCAQCVIDIIR